MHKTTLENEREIIIGANPDLIFGIYELLDENKHEINFRLVPDLLTTYENNLREIKKLESLVATTILSLEKFLNREYLPLFGNMGKTGKYHILSAGTMEFFTKNDTVYLSTLMRDNNSFNLIDKKRTSIAGRMTGVDITSEIEREKIEEAPFLCVKNGEYFLAIPKTGTLDFFPVIEKSVRFFLKNKYIDSLESDNQKKKRIFEKSFEGVSYSDLPKILESCLTNNRFIVYDSIKVIDLPGFEKIYKKVGIDGMSQHCHVFFNKKTNTYEFKHISLTDFSYFERNGIKVIGRLYLESKNQCPLMINVLDLHKHIFSNGVIDGIKMISKSRNEINRYIIDKLKSSIC